MREDGKIDYIEWPGGDLAATKGFYATAFGWTFVDSGEEFEMLLARAPVFNFARYEVLALADMSALGGAAK